MMNVNMFYRALIDIFSTLFLWVIFLGNFFIFYFPICFFLLFLTTYRREKLLQYLNYCYFKWFFFIFRFVVFRVVVKISPEVKRLKSSIIVSNHISYLDPIMLISLFRRQKSIVKGVFFKVPILGLLLSLLGFIPFASSGRHGDAMLQQLDSILNFFSDGGVLFVFPEGKRSRNGKLQTFKKGAFSLACITRTPIDVVCIRNTHMIFSPGKFFFNTEKVVTISIEHVGRIIPPEHYTVKDIKTMRDHAYNLLAKHLGN